MSRGPGRGKRRKSRFSPGVSGRDWRKGRFRLVVLPSPEEEDAFFPQELWGTTAFTVEKQDPPTAVTIEIVRDPYGFFVLAICTACGGRQESIVDGRELAKDMEQVEEDPQGMLKVMGEHLERAMGPTVELWVPRHANCPETPLTHVIPEDVQSFTDRVLDAAREDIGDGIPFEGHVTLLISDGQSASFPIHDLPPTEDWHDARRMNEISARKAAVRDMVGARDLDILAAVTVSEAWAVGAAGRMASGDKAPAPPIHSDPNRREVLMASIVTNNVGRTGIAPIERLGQGREEDAGRVGEMDWRPTGSRSLLLDGLLAVPAITTESPEEKAARAGVDLGDPSDA